MRSYHLSWSVSILALGAAWLGACEAPVAPPQAPAPLTPSQGILGVRVFIANEADVTSANEDCAKRLPGLKKEIGGETQAALSRAGFSIVTDPAGKYDAKARVSVTLDWCNNSEQGGKITLAIEPGATVTGEYSTWATAAPEVKYWDTVLVRRLQEAPQVLALKASTPQPTGSSSSTPATSATAIAVAQPPVPPPAGASDFVAGSPQQDTVALIVGVERYRDVPGATGAKADAETFARVSKRTLGLTESNVHVLLDDRAARSDIQKELDWVRANVPPNGRVIFYFSGHGAPDASAGTPYIVPYDGDPKALNSTAIQLASVIKGLSESKAKEVLAITDSCFAGAGGRSILPPGTRPLVRVKDAPTAARVALFSASSGAQVSGPSPAGGGLFTKYLIDALGTGQADIDGDGRISLHELREWVVPRVTREAKKDNRDQTPSLTVGKGASEEQFLVAIGLTRK